MIQFPYRYIAQIIVEAATPLAVGSGSLLYDQDAPVDRDFNGLPYIPGTAITGYLKRQITDLDYLFGTDPDNMANEENPKGSNIIISDAYLMDKEGKVKQEVAIIEDDFLERYFNLPIRQHTAINEFGAVKDNSKFDTEIVFKGTRFKFEIELQLTKESENWQTILNAFYQNNFYLGAGEFNNFGELKVIEIKEKAFNLEEGLKEDLKKGLNDYLNHSVDLNCVDDKLFKTYEKPSEKEKYKTLNITLSGKDSFFHFGAGFGDDEVDNINYSEFVLDWKSDNSNSDYPFVGKFVIPGTSIKGALAHKVAFYYNKEKGNYVDDLANNFNETIEENLNKKYNFTDFKLAQDLTNLEKQKTELEALLKKLEQEALKTAIPFEEHIGKKNVGVTNLFGTAKDSNTEKGKAGNIIIKDIYLETIDEARQTIFMHNKIDRYTGGTIDTALFGEKVLSIDEITIEIKYKKDTSLTYLNLALQDLKKGMLPIGGLVNKGHGVFVELEEKNNG